MSKEIYNFYEPDSNSVHDNRWERKRDSMDSSILTKVRKVNWVMQEAPKGGFSFDDLCEILSDLTDSNVYVADSLGKILGVFYNKVEDSATIEDAAGIERFAEDYNANLMAIEKTESNIRGDDVLKIFVRDHESKGKYHTIVPIAGAGTRWGTLILARDNIQYEEEDVVLAEIGATAVGMEIQRIKSLEAAEEARNEELVKMAIGTLSYSENEAVIKIFEELEGDEGILVASKIADRSRITRSVIVNALRKLESAGIIESKSLGMKGTHIKVLNKKFFAQLEELE